MQSRRQAQQQQNQNQGLATRAVHGGQRPEENQWQAIVTPIVTSVTNKQNEPGSQRGNQNSLQGNPTRESLEQVLANLDNANCAVTAPSGLAAIRAAANLLKNGDQIVIGNDSNPRTKRLLKEVVSRGGIQVDSADMTNLREVENAIKQNTRMILIETPANPMMKIADIQAIAQLAQKKQKSDNWTQRILVAVDNSTLTPALQRPLDLGADLAITSLTNTMNGHGDVIMGNVSTNDNDLANALRNNQEAEGAVPSPIDCMLVERGLKTLPLRMEQIQRSALQIANALEKNQNVEKVLHPWLKSHPQNDVAQRQSDGHSGVLSVIIKGNGEQAKRALKNLRLVSNAQSVGGCETTACIPAQSEWGNQSQEERNRIGLQDNLIQLSVGLENTEDILKDLEQALGSK
jgi:cystathionine gamma-lyase